MQINSGMNGEWDPSVWHLANELAGLGLQEETRVSPNLDQKQFGWPQAADERAEAAETQRYSPLPLDDSSAKGWGGQASPLPPFLWQTS